MPEPKRVERARALLLFEAGKTAQEIAEEVGVDYSTVRRWINQHEEGPGPNERAVRALVSDWDTADRVEAARAETLITFAVVMDKGRQRDAKGVDGQNAVAAGKELRSMLGELGQSSGFEDLRRALLEGIT